MSKLFDAAIMIAFLTGTLYLGGSVYYIAYLREFGVRLGTFPYRFEDTLLRGFVVLVNVLASQWLSDGLWLLVVKPFVSIVVFMLLVCAILLTISAIKQRKWPDINQFLSEIRNRFSSSSALRAALRGYAKFIAIVVILGFILLFVVTLVTRARSNGENAAAEIKRAFDGNTENSNATTKLTKQLIVYRGASEKSSIKVSGIIVASSDSYFVIYTSTGLIIIPKDRLESIVMFKKSAS